jgi:hypothetical protein
MAAKKKARATSTPSTARRGFFLRVAHGTKTKSGEPVDKQDVVLAVGDPEAGWLPVLYLGRVQLVRERDVELIRAATAKPTTEQKAARKRLVKASGVKVSAKEAERIRAQWKR